VAHDVFISYAHSDKPTADAICAAIESVGVRCWIAPRDVPPGAEWASSILDAISTGRVFVLVFSQHSNASPQVMREVERAVHSGLVIIPFRIEDVPFSKSLEFLLSACHWLDALTPPVQRHIERLREQICRLLEATPSGGSFQAQDSNAGDVPTSFRRKTRWTRRRILVLLSSAAVVASCIFGLVRHAFMAAGTSPSRTLRLDSEEARDTSFQAGLIAASVLMWRNAEVPLNPLLTASLRELLQRLGIDAEQYVALLRDERASSDELHGGLFLALGKDIEFRHGGDAQAAFNTGNYLMMAMKVLQQESTKPAVDDSFKGAAVQLLVRSSLYAREAGFGHDVVARLEAIAADLESTSDVSGIRRCSAEVDAVYQLLGPQELEERPDSRTDNHKANNAIDSDE